MWLLKIPEGRVFLRAESSLQADFSPTCIIGGRVGTFICVYDTAGLPQGWGQVASKPCVHVGPAMHSSLFYFILLIKKEKERKKDQLCNQHPSFFSCYPRSQQPPELLCSVYCSVPHCMHILLRSESQTSSALQSNTRSFITFPAQVPFAFIHLSMPG